jgi:hypothetical protein
VHCAGNDGRKHESRAAVRLPVAVRPPDHPLRDTILAAHAAAIEAGRPWYAEPKTGLFVLTAAFLARRGTCCGSGCRHCPYVDG